MTARQFLFQRRRRNIVRSVGCVLLCVLVFVTGNALGQPTGAIIALTGLVIALALMQYQLFFSLLCPACHGNLAPLLDYRNSFPTDRRIQFCPYCGGDLDEIEVPEPVSTSTSNDRR